VWALAVVVALAAACSGAKGGGAATDGGPGGDGPTDAGLAACDPAAQNCPATSKCDFGCEGSTAVLACRPGGDGGALGSACSAATPCARGSGCLTAEDGGVACRRYCTGDGQCATGERCHNVTVTVNCGGPGSQLPLHYCY
jgi:hypothetical protein